MFITNQNDKYLFIVFPQYTRTAEREASLIRPMPILQKTIDYLLNLLDQPYDDRFLGTYNFLWDRMRAIRMDLRMQHIFNQEAITMLEEMVCLYHSGLFIVSNFGITCEQCLQPYVMIIIKRKNSCLYRWK